MASAIIRWLPAVAGITLLPGALFHLYAGVQWEIARPEGAGVSSAMYVIFSGRKHNGALWDAFCVRKMVLSSQR